MSKIGLDDDLAKLSCAKAHMPDRSQNGWPCTHCGVFMWVPGSEPHLEQPPARLARDMTLREHYAGLAMQAFITRDAEAFESPKQLAEDALDMADALLAALREKSNE